MNDEGESFLDYELGHSDQLQEITNVRKSTFDEFQVNSKVSALILRWALLLHDLAKRRDTGAHPHRGAEIVQQIRTVLWEGETCLDDDSIDMIIWLVKFHDVLGNIYTGERRPSFLLTEIDHFNKKVQDEALHLLQVVILCDFRGTSNGKYLTENKAGFWLGLSDKANIFNLEADLLNWRIQRWTGGLYGADNKAQANELKERIGSNRHNSLIKEVFGEMIDYIVYGFYLFTQLTTERLATLMELISIAVKDNNYQRATLEFETYRPWDNSMAYVLESYCWQIDNRKLKYLFGNNTLRISI